MNGTASAYTCTSDHLVTSTATTLLQLRLNTSLAYPTVSASSLVASPRSPSSPKCISSMALFLINKGLSTDFGFHAAVFAAILNGQQHMADHLHLEGEWWLTGESSLVKVSSPPTSTQSSSWTSLALPTTTTVKSLPCPLHLLLQQLWLPHIDLLPPLDSLM